VTGTVAPARYPLAVLHKQDGEAGRPECPATGEATTGWTACGTPMLESELWQPVPWRPGDRLCGACFPGAPAPAGWTQDPLI
jgi:hypothetical protein